MFALALGFLFVAVASAQILEGQIALPDTLGPLTGTCHLAWDENPTHPRMFVGSEDGDVLVVNALTCERVARILTGPVAGLCYSPPHNKLYVSKKSKDTVAVVDCASLQVVATVCAGSLPTSLIYSRFNDRVYCAANRVGVIDCNQDSLIHWVQTDGLNACFALDSVRHKLYVGTAGPLVAIDCDNDSVTATNLEVQSVAAMCFNPTAGKVYASAAETLFAINTGSDTVVYRRQFDTLSPQLVCDPEHNRIYYTYWGSAIALDCKRDSVIWTKYLWARAIGLAAVPAQDKLYMTLNGLGDSYNYVLDGATGQTLRSFAQGDVPYHSAAANRVFIICEDRLVTAMDCNTDTMVGVILLGANIAHVCMDSVDNKLYFDGGARGTFGVIDCSSNKVKSYSIVCDTPQCLVHDSRDDKLYCSGNRSIFVFDCKADTVVKVIPMGGPTFTMRWLPSLDKLYAVAASETVHVDVIDCVRDTIVKTLGLSDQCESDVSLLAPEFNQFWVFSCPRYTVIDCLHDSIVEDTTTSGSNFWDACYSPTDRRVYTAQNRGLYVFDVDTRLPIDSLPVPDGLWSRTIHYAARARKVYWLCQNQWSPDSVFAVDVRTDSIISRFTVPSMSCLVCDDRTGDYVYFVSDTLVVLDTRTDSAVLRVPLPLSYTESFIRNSKTNRLYAVGVGDSVIQVIYDSVIVAGVQAGPVSLAQPARARTLLCRSEPLRSTTAGVLFDASGRKVAVLQPGSNDISSLMPGVYFVREEPQAASSKPQAVRKLVVAR
jgi:YVTN family beta-propeller protein